MNAITELNAGDRGFVLMDNAVSEQPIISVRVTQSTDSTTVQYEVTDMEGERRLIPAERVAATKQALLAKL